VDTSAFDLDEKFVKNVTKFISPEPVPLPSGSEDSDSDATCNYDIRKCPKRQRRKRRRVGPARQVIESIVLCPLTHLEPSRSSDPVAASVASNSLRPQRRLLDHVSPSLQSNITQELSRSAFPELVQKIFGDLEG
jgi:hypothetical protein